MPVNKAICTIISLDPLKILTGFLVYIISKHNRHWGDITNNYLRVNLVGLAEIAAKKDKNYYVCSSDTTLCPLTSTY